MSRKGRLRIAAIIFAGIFLCAIFSGVVEGAKVTVEHVEVTSSDTEIIPPTYTDKWHNRIFHIENGEHQIIVTVWGSNDNQDWEYWDSEVINPEKTENIVMGVNHYWHVKLTGKTVEDQSTPSMVDASLTYQIP